MHLNEPPKACGGAPPPALCPRSVATAEAVPHAAGTLHVLTLARREGPAGARADKYERCVRGRLLHEVERVAWWLGGRRALCGAAAEAVPYAAGTLHVLTLARREGPAGARAGKYERCAC